MKALCLSVSTVTVLAALSQFALACDGPNCPLPARNGFGAPGPQFSPGYDAWAGARPTLIGPRTACACNSCDPRIPCSPTMCARQGCSDCGTNCPTCPSGRFDSRSPFMGSPSTLPYQSRPTVRPAPLTAQKLCPVTGEKLGSMGPPIPVNVMGKTVYVCCESCVNALRRNPERYLSFGADGRAPMPAATRPTWSRDPAF